VPSGQTMILADVSYTNVSIADTTNGLTENIPGTVCSSNSEIFAKLPTQQLNIVCAKKR
jgi:hypothetical protein